MGCGTTKTSNLESNSENSDSFKYNQKSTDNEKEIPNLEKER